MTITLYKISNDSKDMKKTVDATTKITDLTAKIKEDTTVEKPILEITYNAQYIDANYIYVDDWKRYYFITNRKVGAQRIYLECEVDVLFSFKDGILDLTCVVARQENNSQLYLPDGMFRALTKRIVSTPYKFDTKFDKGQSIVLTTGGKS